MFRRFVYILLHPVFQAIIVAGIIILFVPLGLKKYRTEQAAMSSHFDKTQFIFADLDHDGRSERIHTFLNEAGNAGIVIRTNRGPDQQLNYKGVYEGHTARLMIGDFDTDSLDEIFLFTYEHDSILLHAVKFGKEPKLFVQNRYVATLGKNLKDPDFTIIPGKIADMNGDDRGDLVFGINAGFARYPRNVFIYDIARDSLITSPKSGSFFNQICMANLDSDPFEEITLSTAATDNFNEEPMVYHDSSSWMMALDHDLSFIFPPKEYFGTTGNLINCPVSMPDNKPMLLCIYRGFDRDLPVSRLMLVTPKGEVRMEKDIGSAPILHVLRIFPGIIKGHPNDKVIGFVENGGFYEIDPRLSIKPLKRIRYSGWQPDFMDIDGDLKDEWFIPSKDQKKHLIYRSDFSDPAEIDYPLQAVNPILSIKLNGQEPPQISVQGDQQWWLFNYGINPFYRFRILIYLGIYLSILGFIIVIRKLYAIQLKKKYETEKKITALQLSSIKAQMEPHFIFNVINSIGSSIYREKKDEAYQLVVRFSQMVRSMLSTSDQLYRTLQEELDFVTNFLELERQRFPEVFNYSVHIQEEIDHELFVPKMIVQLHAENAVKHGLRPKGTGGVLEIRVTRAGEYLEITIQDNGIGRHAATGLMSVSTGKGLKILEQLFETYNKHNPTPILQEITDLEDRGKSAGTLVLIKVPMDFNTEIFA